MAQSESGGSGGPDVVELLRALIRFDTTNPPGNETACVEHVRGLLHDAGIDSRILARAENRPNLIARIEGRGEAPPLLLYGHVDVVTTAGQRWTHPPFGGELADGAVWGRGALDMKGGVAMLVHSFIRAHADGPPPGDLVLAVLSDEENGGEFGARFLVEEQPELFEGARHALGEFGGATVHLGGRSFYPIQVAEKQICWLRGVVRGPGGHGAIGVRGSAMGKLGRILTALDDGSLPIHVTPPARAWIEAMADALPDGEARPLRSLLDPASAEETLRAAGDELRPIERALRNTVSATIVHGGEKINVIPSEVELELDGRTLPGFGPDDLIRELGELVGPELELELVRHDPGPADSDLSFLPTLSSILRELDADAIPVPMMQIGVTDGRFFSRIGIQTYGYLPLKLPEGFEFARLVHAADERVPADAVRFGAEAVFRAIERYRG
ncbi:MAG TPA: M20/M25/M40 family metallo-hydrolase [Gaiellaceae bacterium]|nr:M20/M25/M40 family metallo-hydrolase [Gaiellaceae bacterium]